MLLNRNVSGIQTDYAELDELLGRTGSPLPLAELHGGLCGVLSASGHDAGVLWLQGLLEDCHGDDESLAQLSSRLQVLGDETWHALCGVALEFGPLLPDDDAEIDVRARALGLWCHGYLAGLVIGGIDLGADAADMTPEFEELVRDFVEISKAGVDSEELDDPNLGDGSMIELVEFVRIGAQYLFEEFAPRPAGARTIH